ncbi:hypothetical protein CIL05_14275 [Virgibacillus profundi]|uniref:Transcriptional regulator n=1 Tax=Virgibacillus profundi TaxID=2024555 RepID=A0A2A2ICD1_9BACI|nr:sugar diacid recognition domain-containing protein [Virgibacillus profundi]PAV28790.1 hypothetical protein CIL05_14275 [Virgibacillus profundi]PXY52958.1 hypothetical protein CIT14_14400 [Virgibacillus profundi]
MLEYNEVRNNFNGEGKVIEGLVQVAQRIVKAASEISPFPISLTDESGYIIGDSDSSRIGTLHSPSSFVLKQNKLILFDEQTISKMKNVLPGIAVPLIFDNKTLGVLGIIGDPEKVEPHVKLVKKYVEMMWQETIFRQSKQLEKRTEETFIQYILLNEKVNKETVEKFCEILHINCKINRFCIVVDIGDSLVNRVGEKQISLDHLKDVLIDHTLKIFNCKENAICTFLNTGKMVLLKPIPSDEVYIKTMEQFSYQSRKLMEKFLNYQIYNMAISAGDQSSSLVSINKSYHEAERLIKVGNELELLPRIYNYYNWDILLVLITSQIETKLQDKLEFRLKALIEHSDFKELANNFMVYCSNSMNISSTAKELYIHRNTLIYRLKKIEKITTLDTSCFEHCTFLYLILKNHMSKLKK